MMVFLRLRKLISLGFNFHLGSATLQVNLTWLVIAPLGLWTLATLYVPIFASDAGPAIAWALAASMAVLVAASLLAHVLAHLWTARRAGMHPPGEITLFLFGEAAQVWPPSASAGRQVLAAVAGPVVNLLLAGLFYLAWNAGWHPYLNLSTLFLCLFNLWLALVNLVPAFPLDGGRIAWVSLQRLSSSAEATTQRVMRLGGLAGLALIGWGGALLAQRARFSEQTSGVTFVFALLILVGLGVQPARSQAWLWHATPTGPRKLGRILAASLLMLGMTAVSASLLLTNAGLEAPGPALAVEPMVVVPARYRYPTAGSLILTSVLTQTPITAGEWLAGKLNPVYKIVPPESIVPENTTPQEVARQGYQMLDTSETNAIVVGLRLAGFQANLVGKGVSVLAILPDSHANGLLLPGDVITAVNGETVHIATELINQIQSQDPSATVRLQVERNGQVLDLSIPLLPPSAPGDPPRLGIQVTTAGFDVSLPFPVTIVPQKIVGGPSAGLMFALTVYNLVTPQDVTAGWKIAGTGTIDPDGSVGPIGGVEQKVAAAEAAGAAYFLSPVDNYPAARSVARHIQVVEVATIQQALDFLRSLPPR